MKVLEKIQNFIISLNKKDFLKYIYILLFILLIIFGFIVYRHFSKISSLKKQLQRINLARQEAQVILTKDVKAKKQKAIVDNILNKEKNFKLRGYFDSVTSKIGIDKNVKEKSTSESELENLTAQGYIEVKLNAVLADLNMKQLAELLDEFEKNERIYTKSLEITKSNKTPTIDVNLIIATLQPKVELIESTE